MTGGLGHGLSALWRHTEDNPSEMLRPHSSMF